MEVSSSVPMASFPTRKGSTPTQTLLELFLHPITLDRGCRDSRAPASTLQQVYLWANIIRYICLVGIINVLLPQRRKIAL